jgi:hypothetical protein
MPRPSDVNTTVLRPANIEPPLTALQKVQYEVMFETELRRNTTIPEKYKQNFDVSSEDPWSGKALCWLSVFTVAKYFTY